VLALTLLKSLSMAKETRFLFLGAPALIMQRSVEDLRPGDLHSADLGLAELRPAELRSVKLRPAELRPAESPTGTVGSRRAASGRVASGRVASYDSEGRTELAHEAGWLLSRQLSRILSLSEFDYCSSFASPPMLN
jgi:hypothetical protein